VAATKLWAKRQQGEVVEQFLGDTVEANGVGHFRSTNHEGVTQSIQLTFHLGGQIPIGFHDLKAGELALVIEFFLTEVEQQSIVAEQFRICPQQAGDCKMPLASDAKTGESSQVCMRNQRVKFSVYVSQIKFSHCFCERLLEKQVANLFEVGRDT